MFIWKLIGTVHNVAVVMVYIAVGLWTIAIVIKIIRNSKKRRNRK